MVITLSDRAWDNLREIESYLEEEAPYHVEDIISGILASTWRLERHPYSGRKMDDDKLDHMMQSGLRELIHGKYILAYLVDEESETVMIHEIKHSSQNF
jgi:plasmid stabilization system protein ParE